MREATLCYVFDDDEVLLIEKKRGHGAGQYVGPGGKIEAGETPSEAVYVKCRNTFMTDNVGYSSDGYPDKILWTEGYRAGRCW